VKSISIVGCGTSEKSITRDARTVIGAAELLIGSKRLTDYYGSTIGGENVFNSYDVKEIHQFIDKTDKEKIAILVSGDTGFFSLATLLISELDTYNLNIIPGISSVNSFFSKVKMSWQDAFFVSMHGRNANIADIVRRNHKTFILAGNNTRKIAEKLIKADLNNVNVYIGSNLDSDKEEVRKLSIKEMLELDFPCLTVILIINDCSDDRCRIGIDDEEFEREDIPMTKAEIRAIIMSKLKLNTDSICYDIGSGSGSVTIEMALMSWNGKVYAFEKKEEALRLTEKNIKKFHLGNAETILGSAPDSMEAIEAPDAVFIGGSSGNMSPIIEQILEKNPNAQIVVSAIAIETAYNAIEAFRKHNLEYEVCNISASRSREVAGLNMMIALNPIYIINTL